MLYERTLSAYTPLRLSLNKLSSSRPPIDIHRQLAVIISQPSASQKLNWMCCYYTRGTQFGAISTASFQFMSYYFAVDPLIPTMFGKWFVRVWSANYLHSG